MLEQQTSTICSHIVGCPVGATGALCEYGEGVCKLPYVAAGAMMILQARASYSAQSQTEL